MFSAALALIQLLNIVFGYLDAEAKKKAAAALVNAENLQADLKAISLANAARADAVTRFERDPGSIREPDADSRP